jgi:hypothetical protein
MSSTITNEVVNARIIMPNGKTRLQRVIKKQLWAMRGDIKDHLIGNIYHDMLTHKIIIITEEYDTRRKDF